MKKKDTTVSDFEGMRLRAEGRLKSRTAYFAEPSPEEAQALIHELQVHQIELEMQNEHLRQTQAELEAALAKYSDFYDFAPVAYLTLDERGLILEANLTAATMLGVERSGLLQRLVTNYIVREDRTIYFRHRQGLFETQGPQHYELRMVRKNGAPFWAQIATVGALDSNKAQLCKATISDITERRQNEENLRQTRDYLDKLISHANAPMIVWDPESKITRFNRAFENLTGYATQEVIGRKLEMLFPEASRKESLSKIARTSGGEYWESVEIPILLKDSNTRIVLWNSANMHAEDGTTLVATIAQGQDITERKRAEEAFQVLVNKAPMGIFIEQDGKFQLVNPGFEIATGYTAQELLGHDSLKLVSPDYRKMVRENALHMLKGELDLPYEFPITNKSGETRWVMEKLTATEYQGKRATLGYFLDVTEHKSLEDQFLQAQKMEAVGRLAGGVAHDFNNLLSVIFGYSDLMNQALHQHDPLARYLAEIIKASDRATALTRQLLAFSRKTIMAPQILNLNDQLVGTEKMLARLIGADIEIRMILEPALGAVHADPGHVEQIVMNLVVNARDAMPKGGELTLETVNVYLDEDYARKRTYVTPGHYVMLAVTDNGQGMDAATLGRIFEPFFTTKDLGRGTGLGLSTVYGLVKQNGGYIEVYSEVGHGTTFKVYLPQVQEAVPAVSEAKPLAIDFHGSETILVVEDEDMLRESICRSLKIYGYTVLAARHGGEAVLLCERHPGPIHFLLTDVVMPQMNGRDLADRLTSLQPDIKVLYMSGYTENAIVRHGVLEANIFFIQKPFRTNKLMEKIRYILTERLRQP